MKKRYIKSILTGAALCISLAAAPVTSFAATPEEAAEVARAYGIPEDFIQQAWNSFYAEPEKYPPEVIDSYIEIIKNMSEDSIAQLIGGGSAPTPAPTPTPDTPPAQSPEGGETGNNSGESGEEGGSTSEEAGGNSGGITLTLPDGSTFDRVSSADFAKMTMEEKQAYYASLTPEQQAAFIANLSPEDYKSLIKQLPSDQKAEIIDSMTVITNDLGLNLTVDEISDNNLNMSLRNEKGELIAVGSAKDNVANTGYDRRGILAVAASFVLVGIGGAAVAVTRSFRRETETENE